MRKHTEIAFVLDRSGSMESCSDAAIAGFNKFLRDQQQVEGEAKLTLVLFDDQYEVPVRSIPVREVVELDKATYEPRGSTALLDAIGKTVDDLGKAFSELPEDHRPGQVIIAILTDGHENSSERFTWKDVAKRIKHQTEVYKWTFLFLGANQDAIATAAKMNIGAASAATFAADDAGVRSSTLAFSRKVTSLRRRSLGTASVAEAKDAEASMSTIFTQEDRKQQRQGAKPSKT